MKDYTTIPVVSQPFGLKTQLFPHQLAMIHKMERMEQEQVVECKDSIKETRLGINADQTGFGKTYSMIGLIIRDKMLWDLNVPFLIENITTEAGGIIKKRTIKRVDKLPCTVILVSTSIVGQWKKELSNSNLAVCVIINKRDIDYIDVEHCDVVLVTINTYNNLMMSFANYSWKRFIFDEPGHTRVSSMKNIQAGFYWFVTATPNAILTQHHNCRGSMMKNIIGENWVDFESQFNDMILKNDTKFTELSFQLPQIHTQYHKCFQPLLTVVGGIVNSAIKNMIEAGNIEGAITALGGSKTKNIIELVRKKKLEELELSESKIRIYKIREDPDKVKEWIIKKEHTESQIKFIKDRFNTLLLSCHICMESITNPVLEPNCQILFCGNCLLKWLALHNTCPICRHTVKTEELIYVANKIDDPEEHNYSKLSRLMTKPEKIIELIKSKKDGKFLIFSAYEATFDIICKVLSENSITFVKLVGSAAQRQKNIEQFKGGYSKVILLNSNLNSAGINLQETSDIIIYHPMQDTTQNQIIARAQRIGRTEPLYVHHLEVDI